MTLPPILGHGPVLTHLLKVFEQDALHHALLLEGPMGIGKGLVARRLAMTVNCEADPPRRPCGVCGACRQIAAGTHPDVILLEPDLTRAARAIPVDAIRRVIRQAQFHRYSARHRFVIVDPAEAMAEPAANALLKTLEEPPAGTGFVVISHNPQALLPTIRSRCQRVRLGAVPEAEIASWLTGRGGNADAAATAARLAWGCPGHALSLVEGRIEARTAVRAEILAVIRASLPDRFKYTNQLTRGGRAAWSDRVALLLDVVEDLIRDAAVHASGAAVPLLNADIADEVGRWSGALWPDGIARCALAVQDCRDDLELYVSGKTALDALFCSLQQELRA